MFLSSFVSSTRGSSESVGLCVCSAVGVLPSWTVSSVKLVSDALRSAQRGQASYNSSQSKNIHVFSMSAPCQPVAPAN
jgi:hypothetical protein